MKRTLSPNGYSWRPARLGMTLLWCLFVLSCDKGTPEELEPDDPVRTDTQLKVTNYALPPGKTEEFPAGFEIVASEGIDVAGTLIVRPTRAGTFTLRAETGDIRITGKVLVQEEAPAKTGTWHGAFDKSTALRNQAAAVPPSLNFIVDRPGAVLSLGRSAQIKAGDGSHAPEELVVLGGGRIVGQVGAPGGDIILRAGTIILPEDRQAGDPPLFVLGNGGDGANVTVDRESFRTSDTRIELVGGRGGDSGLLFLEAGTITGVPAVDQLNPEAELLAGGQGGKGGNVVWDNSYGSVIAASI